MGLKSNLSVYTPSFVRIEECSDSASTRRCVVARNSNFLAYVCQTAKLGITINIFCHASQSVTRVEGNLNTASDNAPRQRRVDAQSGHS